MEYFYCRLTNMELEMKTVIRPHKCTLLARQSYDNKNIRWQSGVYC